MWDSIWQILGVATAGGLLWLGIVFLLALLGELGLPATSPILEGLLIFTGFQIAHGAYIVALIPFLAIAYTGRLCGSASLYCISSSSGSKIIDKFGKYIRVTREHFEWVRKKSGALALPSIITARFIPGFTIVSSVACGISRISYKNFFAAVAIHVLIWEAIFLTLGALGSRVSKFFDPQAYPMVLVIWIGVMVVVGTALGYIFFRRVKNSK